MSTTPLAIDLIRTDGGTQMRAELNQEVIDDYAEKWLAGFEFPAIDVYHDGANYWPSDGFHRLFGAIKAKRASIPCNVRRGTQRDAILAATGANRGHGLRRTNADKRKAVETLLNDNEWCGWSDNKIAEQASVSQNFVSTLRRQLTSDVSSPASQSASAPRVGRDGRKRKPPKRKSKPNGRPAKATADLAEGYVDDSGNEVPESLFPVWRQRETYFRICDDLKTLAGEIRELGKTPAGRGCSAIAREVDEAGKALALCIPSVVNGKVWKSVGNAK